MRTKTGNELLVQHVHSGLLSKHSSPSALLALLMDALRQGDIDFSKSVSLMDASYVLSTVIYSKLKFVVFDRYILILIESIKGGRITAKSQCERYCHRELWHGRHLPHRCRIV